jgi:hypothetical protein
VVKETGLDNPARLVQLDTTWFMNPTDAFTVVAVGELVLHVAVAQTGVNVVDGGPSRCIYCGWVCLQRRRRHLVFLQPDRALLHWWWSNLRVATQFTA